MADLISFLAAQGYYERGYQMCADGKPTLTRYLVNKKGGRIQPRVKQKCKCGKTYLVAQKGRRPKKCSACRSRAMWEKRK